MNLSSHFTLREMTRSAAAEKLGIDNVPNEDQIARLRSLCEAVVEPLRRRFGPLRINSGFRCEKLNRAVGGSEKSQHMRGEAADLVPLAAGIIDLALFAVDRGLPFDQFIVYPDEKFVHVSHRSDGVNRGELLICQNRVYSAIAPGALRDMSGDR
jgi:hypothetical protein